MTVEDFGSIFVFTEKLTKNKNYNQINRKGEGLMEIQLQELIDQIKKDGVDAAEAEATSIVDCAKAEAEKIIADAKAQAETFLSLSEKALQRSLTQL